MSLQGCSPTPQISAHCCSPTTNWWLPPSLCGCHLTANSPSKVSRLRMEVQNSLLLAVDQCRPFSFSWRAIRLSLKHFIRARFNKRTSRTYIVPISANLTDTRPRRYRSWNHWNSLDILNVYTAVVGRKASLCGSIVVLWNAREKASVPVLNGALGSHPLAAALNHLKFHAPRMQWLQPLWVGTGYGLSE